MKRFLFIFLFLISGLVYIFELDNVLEKYFSSFSTLKSAYINTYIGISEKVANHFKQEKLIKKLQEENIELQEYKLLYDISSAKINNLKEFLKNIEFPDTSFQFELIRVLSYIEFDDFTSVWLEKEPEKDDKILGLISDNYAAGIAINRHNKSVGLLNGSKDCTYAVFIGKDKSPGIIGASENNQNELAVKFIPIWSNINIGDEVVTSGMDNIFYEGLKVGKVTEIKEFPDMKIAKVKPYAKPLEKRFFYTYKANIKEQDKEKSEDKN